MNLLKKIAGAALVVITGLVLCTNTAVAADVVYTTTYVNVRIQPKISMDTLAFTLAPNTKVIRVDNNDAWDTIEIDNKKYYIYDKYISSFSASISASSFKKQGVFYWGNLKWTYYSQKVLPGGGLSIPGRSISENGYIIDENVYICCASADIAHGTVIDTPLGAKGKIYDTAGVHGIIDVYVNW